MTIDTLNTHLKSGATHVCTCWSVRRVDGKGFGFTDHDMPLVFDGTVFAPDSGLSAKAIATTTGLSVNNSEALGVLSADAVTEGDIEAGRYDGAEVTVWLVQWDNVSAREIQFFGTIGEITREAGTYQAELRGLTEMLSQDQGRAYLRSCSAVLGDAKCTVNTGSTTFSATAQIQTMTDQQKIQVTLPNNFTSRWFEGGSLTVNSGAGAGITASIKSDEGDDVQRVITLWEPLHGDVQSGDEIAIVAGCDRRARTCAAKFSNTINFQGFPNIPGADWLMTVPRSSDDENGGSLTR